MIVRAHLEHTRGVHVEAETVDSPSWETVVSMIARLDGRETTLLTLEGQSGQLTIGGGDRQRYVVFAAFGEDHIFSLYSTQFAEDTKPLQMVAGGQLGDYEQRQCCNQSEVRTVAQLFAQAEQMDQTMKWVEE